MNEYRNWTSLNSGKLFSHIERWEKIKNGKPIPPPCLITVDPSNYCNLNCEWCNARKMLDNKKMLSKKTLMNFSKMIDKWNYINGDKEYKVSAICIAGGGEPLANPYVGEFMRDLHQRNIKVTTTTNGFYIDRFLDDLLANEYVAVSVDAATSKTFNKYKGLKENDNYTFNKILNNIELLCKESKKNKCNLGKKGRSFGVNYRMLLYKDNISEIYESAKIAQELGCSNLIIRPASVPFDGSVSFAFNEDDIKLFNEQVQKVNKIKKKDFGFYYTIDKVGTDFNKDNDFNKCHALFMTATLMPGLNTEIKDGYCLNVCCDRRSDKLCRLLTNETDIQKIRQIWGRDSHWDIFNRIDNYQIKEICPRCTYYNHNKIYEEAIEVDNLLKDFI